MTLPSKRALVKRSQRVRRNFSRHRHQPCSPIRRLRAESLESRQLLAAEIEPNDTIQTATILPTVAGGELVEGLVSSVGDVDYFRLSLQQGDRFELDPFNRNAPTFSPTLPPGLSIVDSDGNVIVQSNEGSDLSFVAPDTQQYFLRIASQNAYGTFVGDYGMQSTVIAGTGPQETEPNQAPFSPQDLPLGVQVEGSLPANDIDQFNLSLEIGETLVLAMAGTPDHSPAIRLLDATGGVVVPETTSGSFVFEAQVAGTYTLDLRAPTGGMSTVGGQYVFIAQTYDDALSEVEQADPLTGATDWAFTDQLGIPDLVQRTIGQLDSTSDVDVYRFEVDDLYFINFRLDVSGPDYITGSGKTMTLLNQYGQFLSATNEGTLSTRMVDAFQPGVYYLAVSANSPAGLGAYQIQGNLQYNFSLQRDYTTHYMEFDQQTNYFGNDRQNPYAVDAARDYYVGSFDAKYAAFDVVSTLNPVTDGNEHVQQGIGDFGDIGAGGLGSHRGGLRAAQGLAVTSATEQSVGGLNYLTTPTVYHEFGHAVGLPHSRDVQAFMSYVGSTERLPSGSIFSFQGTDSRRPGTSVNNHRNFLDWSLQSGAQVVLTGDDDDTLVHSLDSYLQEMTIDHSVTDSLDSTTRALQVDGGDFNGDGREDIVAINEQDGDAIVWLTGADGSIGAPAAIDLSTRFDFTTEPLSVGDFNADGRDDLAVGLSQANQVAVLTADANGVMGNRVNLTTPGPVLATTSADLDGDGDIDVAAVTSNPTQVSVFINNGAGTFSAATSYGTVSNPRSIDAGDFDGDGLNDLFVGNWDSPRVAVYRNGSGVFNRITDVTTAGNVRSLAVDDFDNDGDADLAIASGDPRLVQVFESFGNGAFIATQTIPTRTNSQQLQVEDIDGDGNPDLLLGGRSNSGAVLLGLGDNQFTRTISIGSTNGDEVSVTAVDLDGDGNQEIVTADLFANAVTVTREAANNPEHNKGTGNDKVIVLADLDGARDVDRYSFNPAGETRWDIDIDAAEFQMPVDAYLIVRDATGAIIGQSDNAMDRHSGVESVDPYVRLDFQSLGSIPAGPITVEVAGRNGSSGNYRLKVIPGRAFETDAPRVIGVRPDNADTLNATNQILVLFDDIIDPQSIDASSVQVTNSAGVVMDGDVVTNPFEASLIWTTSTALSPDTYTITLNGITDFAGNALDGETTAGFAFPDVSGNGVAGGTFASSFTITGPDGLPAVVNSVDYLRDPYQRGKFTLSFSDELGIQSARTSEYFLRGAGPDQTLDTLDDSFAPLDAVYDPIRSWRRQQIILYSRGIPDSGVYRIEGTLTDGAGLEVVISTEVTVSGTVPEVALFSDSGLTTPGLIGSYVDSDLGGVVAPDDWRTTQTIAGTRTDLQIAFDGRGSFGTRADVGITTGADDDWGSFSVQWDGYIDVPEDGIQLLTRSDDSSRMWIDLNGDGNFGNAPGELVNNNWGRPQALTDGDLSTTLGAGAYAIRVQYQETFGNEAIFLQWVRPDRPVDTAGYIHGPVVVGSSILPGEHLTSPSQLSPDPIGNPNTTTNAFSVTFNAQIDTSTLTPDNLFLRRSDDNQFFDADDEILLDADGVIQWDPSTLTATIELAENLSSGFYLLEVNGESDGVRDMAGHLLDGEFLSSHIAGNADDALWKRQPSGDGVQGGTYRSTFSYSPPRLYLEPAASVLSELGGTAQVRVTRLFANTSLPMTVSLNSLDTSELSVPASVTIPAGAESITFTVNGVDDQLLDGLQTAGIVATATNIESGETSIDVSDYEPIIVSLGSSQISEAGGLTDLILTRTDTSAAQVVTLTNGDNSEVSLPGSVTFAAGERTLRVAIRAVDDAVVDGSQFVVIRANGAGLISDSVTLEVTDFEPLSFQLDESVMSEKDGLITGVLQRTDPTTSLVATLFANPLNELQTLPTVRFLAGQFVSSPFVIRAQDNDLLDGSRDVQLFASAPGYVDDTTMIQITDHEELQLLIQESPISEKDGTTTVRALRQDASGDLTGLLTASPDTGLTFSSQIIFDAGQMLSRPITVNAVDDDLLTGDRRFTLTASATDYVASSADLVVSDHEELSVQWLLPGGGALPDGVLPEDAEGAVLRVSLPANLPVERGSITINLTSTNPGALDSPEIATIPVGGRFVDIPVSAFDNAIVDGDKSLTMIVDSQGFVSNQIDLQIEDDDVPELNARLILPPSQIGSFNGEIPEENGVGTILLTRNTISETSVRLTSVPNDQYEFPTELVFPRGFRLLEIPFTTIDNQFVDGDRDASITVNVTGHPARTLDLTVVDDERAGVSVLDADGNALTNRIALAESPTSSDDLSSQLTNSIVVNVALPSAPLSRVVLDVVAPDSVSTNLRSLTFTPSNWNVPQSLVITANNDLQTTGDRLADVLLSVDTIESNAAFVGVADKAIELTIIDDDRAAIIVTQSDDNTYASETGMQDEFFVRLATQPSENVIISFDNADIASVTMDPAVLTFTSENWNRVQAVEVKTDRDFDADGNDIGIVYLDVASSSQAFGYDTIGRRRLSVVHVDAELSDLRLRSDGNTVTLEDVTTSTVLETRPASNQSFVTGSRDERITVQSGMGLSTLQVDTSGGDDTLVVTADDDDLMDCGDSIVIACRVGLNGGSGYDRLQISLPDFVFDPGREVASNNPVAVSAINIEEVHTDDDLSQTLIMTPGNVRLLTDNNNDLFVQIDEMDDLRIGDQWSISTPVLVDGIPAHRFTFGDTTLRLAGGTVWQNPLNPADVNASGEVTALDALMIINRLNEAERQGLSEPSRVTDANDLLYYDVSGDGVTSAMDALRTINALNALDAAVAGGEPILPPYGSSLVTTLLPLGHSSAASEQHDDVFAELAASPAEVLSVQKVSVGAEEASDWQVANSLAASVIDELWSTSDEPDQESLESSSRLF